MALERSLESLSDDELLRGLAVLLCQSRRAEAELVAHIGEVDERRLFAREGFPSMYVYCVEGLHLSEAEAYLRINVARAARQHPVLLEMLGDGRLHLSGIDKLAAHLTPENRDVLLSRAVHKTKRQIEELLAGWDPRPDVPAVIRKLPDRARPSEPAIELRLDGVPSDASPREETSKREVPVVIPSASVIEPLSPTRYKVQFTAGAALHEKLERLRALLRHEVPDGDLAQIIESAVTEKLERLEARRFGRRRSEEAAHSRLNSPKKVTVQTQPSSRHIPAAVRREVYRRDGGRCRFVGAHGRRCPERHRLEYHHRHPFALGGESKADNICLMCPAHNRLMAEVDYGRKAMSRFGAGPGSARSGTLSGAELRPDGVGGATGQR